eukprot:CAMPEP_0178526086 /NCGR_PEP_ID=MMETSP0696-20121128/30538_1 /TAXON_ID=265572 /ORGANISM="Extubocellulus spinifer, Strain CCMP396" /LENGTH=712 /DNA_ID=CAMNT_0020157563 /DNA_START=85 /DNA_END=2223 /DNA_ORIENTATION=+
MASSSRSRSRVGTTRPKMVAAPLLGLAPFVFLVLALRILPASVHAFCLFGPTSTSTFIEYTTFRTRCASRAHCHHGHHRYSTIRRSLLAGNDEHDDESSPTNTEEQRPLQRFESILNDMSMNDNVRTTIPAMLLSAGFTSTSELALFASDFVGSKSPEVLSKILQTDFGFNPYQSHLCRAALFELVRSLGSIVEEEEEEDTDTDTGSDVREDAAETAVVARADGSNMAERNPAPASAVAATRRTSQHDPADDGDADTSSSPEPKKPLFKQVVVNPKARKRAKHGGHEYGLPSNYAVLYPTVANELKEFVTYMTRPSASSQEPPIREATAKVYLRHSKLFLGWYLRRGGSTDSLDMGTIRSALKVGVGSPEYESISDCCRSYSLYNVVPNKDASSAQPIVDFILWLRQSRDISYSYEANVLRGLTKLLKYRFSVESTADPTYGEKSFHDIPAVRELRKLHRDANRRQMKSPRSSDEARKWISWNEYLGVVDALKKDVVDELDNLDVLAGKYQISEAVGRRIATKYQRYLVLAFFSCVPDRQRTVRELELGRTFLRNDEDNVWTVKHSPDDYKTGGTYGDRPPLALSPELTAAIDDFLQDWRPYFNPTGQHVFAQPRTGKQLTQDSVYSIVARSCYTHTGKKTNPHLLRDMIVTHVRESSGATERDLEALALFMGHSVAMQRTSYDRRTMNQKVAPAVALLKSVNQQGKGESSE